MSNQLVINKTISIPENYTEDDLLNLTADTIKTQVSLNNVLSDPNLELVSLTFNIQLVLKESEELKEKLDNDFWVGVATGTTGLFIN